MKHRFDLILLLSTGLLLTGCAATKIVTVPVKATAGIVGGTADLLD